MITRPARFAFAQRAAAEFAAQTYREKELVIVGWDPRSVARLVDMTKQYSPEARVVGRTTQHSGPPWKLLQEGIDASSGDWLACWDDDNKNHRGRLARQMELAKDNPIAFTGCLYAFYESQELFLFDPPAAPAKHPNKYSVPYTTIFPRHHLKQVPKVDDRHPWVRAVRDFIEAKGVVDKVAGEWKWFVTGVGALNIRGYEFHRELATCGYSWTADKLRAWEPELQTTLGDYIWDTDMTMCGRDGIAWDYLMEGMFTWQRAWGFDPLDFSDPSIEQINEA